MIAANPYSKAKDRIALHLVVLEINWKILLHHFSQVCQTSVGCNVTKASD